MILVDQVKIRLVHDYAVQQNRGVFRSRSKLARDEVLQILVIRVANRDVDVMVGVKLVVE